MQISLLDPRNGIGSILKKFGKDIESMTDIAIEAFIHTIQSRELYIIILGIVCIFYFDKIMKL
jgi:hypothetical protein